MIVIGYFLPISVLPFVGGFLAGFTVGSAISGLVEGLTEVIRVLVTDGASIFTAILIPCKLFAGVGILYGIIPLLNIDIHKLKNDGSKIISMLLLAVLLMGDGKMAQAIGVANYATIKGVNQAISAQMEAVGRISQLGKQNQEDRTASEEIKAKVDDCLKIPASQANGTTNPALNQCEQELRALVQSKKINNPNLNNQLTAALAKGDLLGVSSSIISATAGYIGNGLMEVPRAIFNAWKAAIAMLADLALVLSLVFLPIPLSFSLLSPAPLLVWFSSFWAVGFYQFCLTILAGAFSIIEAKVGAGAPMFWTELLSSIVAPIIAAIMAAGGGIGLFKALQQFSGTAASIATKAVAA